MSNGDRVIINREEAQCKYLKGACRLFVCLKLNVELRLIYGTRGQDGGEVVKDL